MNKRELGINYFKQGYNCSQAVALAFKDELGLNEKSVALYSSAFGGGFGRLREVCGAISGMAMVIGAKFGFTNPSDSEGKMKVYAITQELIKEFTKINGSMICANLLDTGEATTTPTPSERTTEYYKKRPCAEYVGDACEILEKYLTEKGLM